MSDASDKCGDPNLCERLNTLEDIVLHLTRMQRAYRAQLHEMEGQISKVQDHLISMRADLTGHLKQGYTAPVRNPGIRNAN